MRHRKKSEKFSRPHSQAKALVKSLLRATIINERIITTTRRAKYLRSEVDRLITWGKQNTLADRRMAYRLLESHSLVKRLFDVIAPRFKNINGGYTRRLSVGNRKGDGAPLSLFELTKIEKKEPASQKKSTQKEEKLSSKKEKEAKIDKKEKKGLVSGVRKIFKKGKKISSS